LIFSSDKARSADLWSLVSQMNLHCVVTAPEDPEQTPGEIVLEYRYVNGAFQCADRVKATVVRVDISEPDENDVYLKGQDIAFDGQIAPAGLGGVSYSWSVLQGTCNPSTANTQDFVTTFESEGIIQARLRVTAGAFLLDKIRTIETVRPEVTNISWKNDHDPIKEWEGNDIQDPVWIKVLGGGVTKNKPGAYTKNGEAMAELEIEGSKSLTHSTSVQVKGNGNKENFISTGAYFHHWTWNPGELQLSSSQLYGSVNFYDSLDVTWCYCVQRPGGGWGGWVEMNQSSHLLYTVDNTPAADPLYDLGLDKACRYADGEADFAEAINIGIASDIYYNPGKLPHLHGSDSLGIFERGEAQCCCNAWLLSTLIAHISSESPQPLYGWCGCTASIIDFYRCGDWWGPSFQCVRPATDGADLNPHFTFHMEVPFDGVVYDPSYGLTGWPAILEKAPTHLPYGLPASFQTGADLPENRHYVDWP